MKKKTEPKAETVITAGLNDLISERYGDYAKYIIQDRALPDARDGLKPVQRRILYAMYKDGNTPDKPFRKSAKTVGLVIGNYHPHGDSSVYEAMVRLSQSWKQNYPLVEMHGNNGSIDDDPAAAMRYTEARLAPISMDLLEDINKNTVAWTPNFDDTENEPTVLPAKFPNLLVNGATGIASGYATSIPPHNLNEITEGTIYRIHHPHCSLDDIMKIIPGPDFPTGGIVQGAEGIRECFDTGRGKIVVRGKVSIETTKTVQQIIITEIPFDVIKAALVKKIDDIRFNKDIDGILDVRDESDRSGLKIVIDVHRDIDVNMVLAYLYKTTDLQINYNYNMIAIVNKRPEQLGLLAMLDSYIAFSRDFVLARSKYEFDQRMERLNILQGLIKAISILDQVIHLIRHSHDKADAKARLMEQFAFNEAQAEAIVTLRLYRLTNTDITELKDEYTRIVGELKELNEIIQDPKKLDEVICGQLKAVARQYGQPRRTAIESEVEDLQIDKTRMVANERVMVTLSRDGYVKRVSLRSYNANDTMTGLKQDDRLVGFIEADSVDSLMAFTESGEYVILPIYQLADSKWKDVGQHISNYVRVNNAEKFIGACLVKDFNTYAWIITASSRGMIKRTALSKFALQRMTRSSTAMQLDAGDRLIGMKVAYAGDEVALVTRGGYALRYNISQLSDIGVRTKGVKAVSLAGQDALASLAIIDGSGTEMVYITDRASAKRLKIADVTVTSRATRGLLIAKRNKTNPALVAASIYCGLYDDLNLVTDEGKLALCGKDISLIDKEGRYSNPLTSRPWYHVEGIQEVRLVDIPLDAGNQKGYEEIQLEV